MVVGGEDELKTFGRPILNTAPYRKFDEECTIQKGRANKMSCARWFDCAPFLSSSLLLCCVL